MTSINDPLSDREYFLLKAASPVADVVADHVELQPGEDGALHGLCPFREEAHNFHISPELGRWACSDCSDGGDVINFIRRLKNITYAEAAVYLLRRLNRPTPRQIEQLKSQLSRRA